MTRTNVKTARTNVKTAHPNAKMSYISDNQARGNARKAWGNARKAWGNARKAQWNARKARGNARKARGNARKARGNARKARGNARKAWGNARKAQWNARKARGNAREAWGNARKAWGNARKARGNARKAGGNARKARGWIHKLLVGVFLSRRKKGKGFPNPYCFRVRYPKKHRNYIKKLRRSEIIVANIFIIIIQSSVVATQSFVYVAPTGLLFFPGLPFYKNVAATPLSGWVNSFSLASEQGILFHELKRLSIEFEECIPAGWRIFLSFFFNFY